jgi:hypothetical protein
VGLVCDYCFPPQQLTLDVFAGSQADTGGKQIARQRNAHRGKASIVSHEATIPAGSPCQRPRHQVEHSQRVKEIKDQLAKLQESQHDWTQEKLVRLQQRGDAV